MDFFYMYNTTGGFEKVTIEPFVMQPLVLNPGCLVENCDRCVEKKPRECEACKPGFYLESGDCRPLMFPLYTKKYTESQLGKVEVSAQKMQTTLQTAKAFIEPAAKTMDDMLKLSIDISKQFKDAFKNQQENKDQEDYAKNMEELKNSLNSAKKDNLDMATSAKENLLKAKAEIIKLNILIKTASPFYKHFMTYCDNINKYKIVDGDDSWVDRTNFQEFLDKAKELYKSIDDSVKGLPEAVKIILETDKKFETTIPQVIKQYDSITA